MQAQRSIRLIAVAAALAVAGVAQADVAVIVNAANSAALDDDAVAALFLGQSRSFAGGAEAVPVNQKDAAAPTPDFTGRYLKKTPQQLRAFWAKQVFTGGGKPPKELDGDDAVAKFVAATPGGIGYVDAAFKLPAGVKVAKR